MSREGGGVYISFPKAGRPKEIAYIHTKKWMFGEEMLRSVVQNHSLPKGFAHSSSSLSRWDRSSMELERSSLTLEPSMKHFLLGPSPGAFWVHNSDLHRIQSLKSRSVARKQSSSGYQVLTHSVSKMKVVKNHLILNHLGENLRSEVLSISISRSQDKLAWNNIQEINNNEEKKSFLATTVY